MEASAPQPRIEAPQAPRPEARTATGARIHEGFAEQQKIGKGERFLSQVSRTVIDRARERGLFGDTGPLRGLAQGAEGRPSLLDRAKVGEVTDPKDAYTGAAVTEDIAVRRAQSDILRSRVEVLDEIAKVPVPPTEAESPKDDAAATPDGAPPPTDGASDQPSAPVKEPSAEDVNRAELQEGAELTADYLKSHINVEVASKEEGQPAESMSYAEWRAQLDAAKAEPDKNAAEIKRLEEGILGFNLTPEEKAAEEAAAAEAEAGKEKELTARQIAVRERDALAAKYAEATTRGRLDGIRDALGAIGEKAGAAKDGVLAHVPGGKAEGIRADAAGRQEDRAAAKEGRAQEAKDLEQMREDLQALTLAAEANGAYGPLLRDEVMSHLQETGVIELNDAELGTIHGELANVPRLHNGEIALVRQLDQDGVEGEVSNIVNEAVHGHGTFMEAMKNSKVRESLITHVFTDSTNADVIKLTQETVEGIMKPDANNHELLRKLKEKGLDPLAFILGLLGMQVLEMAMQETGMTGR